MRLSTALRATITAALAAAVLTGPSRSAPAARPAATGTGQAVVGGDISWPNCPKGMGIPSRPTQGQPMPSVRADFVVIGLTNGPAFHPNPCLGAQVAWARTHHVWTSAYAVATYPTAAQYTRYAPAGPHTTRHAYGGYWNTGYAQARFNIDNMLSAGLSTPMVWVDVEPVSRPAPWSHSVRHNRAVVEGVIATYRAAGFEVGIYSTRTMWRGIVGDARYGLPEWRTAGQTSRTAATATCRHGQIQGGSAVLAQWWGPRRDFDTVCPGRSTSRVLHRYFTQL